MKILVPDKIRDNLSEISSIWLDISHSASERFYDNFISTRISKSHLDSVDFIELHDETFKRCNCIQYRVLYKNKTTQIFKFNTKHQATHRLKDCFSAPTCVRYKSSIAFEDTSEGKQKLFFALNDKIEEANSYPITTKGRKKLVYYTVYFDSGYVDLLNLSVESILKYSTTSFDVLIITDEPTRLLIEQSSFVQKITPKYLITPTPFDGVEASTIKTKVFEYSDINSYDKILYVDCDVMAVKDIKQIFSLNLEHNTLYTAYNSNLTYNHFRTIHHGFDCLDESFVKEMKKAKQMPFNAGQFMFRNSDRMKEHFANVNWMMENWSGEYFFEQCFMNYYFCKAHLTESTSLNNLVNIISTINEIKYTSKDDAALIHFIAPALNAKMKLEFINNLQCQNLVK